MSDQQHEEGHDHHPHGDVRIHFEQRRLESPTPTTGEALHALCHIKPEHRLYRLVEGNHDDELIECNAHPVHLKQDDHFYSEEVHHRHEYTIIVNAREKHVHARKLSFEAVVALAFPKSFCCGSETFTRSRAARS